MTSDNRNGLVSGGPAFRRGLACFLFLIAAALMLAAPHASAQRDSAEIAIEAQPLEKALIELSTQTGVGIFARGELVEGLQAPPLDGSMSMEDALQRLLSGTGLTYEQNDDGSYVVLSSSAALAGQDQTGQRQPGIEEIIVTGQKREERIQDVPIAISAFSPEDLEAQKIEGGFDLLKGVPNVTFTKTNFTGYNFQIRGIGTQAISATTDPAVAVSQNDTTLIVNRLFEQEYLDVERVEVLRGPQGTLYGRNATAGVVNVITHKPELGVWDGMIDVEVGNYNTRRLRGMFNVPIGETLAIRGAYASTQRDGFTTNSFDNDDIDGRDLWTGRLTLGWQPNDRLRVNLMWEHFEEDDDRLRSVKQLCHRDNGPEQIAGLDVSNNRGARRKAQQGCLPGSLYSDSAFQLPNGDAFPFVNGARRTDTTQFCSPAITFSGCLGAPLIGSDVSVFASPRQSRDLRSVFSRIEPRYRADTDIFGLSFNYQWTDALEFKSHTVYVDDELFSTQDFNRFEPTQGIFTNFTEEADPPFNGDDDGDGVIEPGEGSENFLPGGVFCDPQLGCSDSFIIQDISQSDSEQFNQQFQLSSSFAGAFNFSLGVNYTRFETTNDYFVFSNVLSAFAQAPPFDGPDHQCTTKGLQCVSIQQEGLEETAADPFGHNFFLSRNPYELNSVGIFGETYWQATDTLKVTAGLRYTWDEKVFSPVPSQTLLADFRENRSVLGPDQGPEECTQAIALCPILGNAPGGAGYPAGPDIVQSWREPTGRLVVDWSPVLGFTDETLVYGSFSHGYKGGGANPPTIAPPAGLFIEEAQGAVASKTFEPEFINAYEIGTKNTLFGGALTLNGTAFYYDYTDYQVSKIVDRSAANENFDAEVWGLEFESIFAPSLNWQFNASIGYLQTEVARGEQSIDLMDRAQGGDQFFITGIENPAFNGDQANARPRSNYEAGVSAPADQEFLAFDEWVVVKPNATQSSNCVAPAEVLALPLQVGFNNLSFACPAGTIAGSAPGLGPIGGDGALKTIAPNGGAGFFDDIGGNELPNAPEFTVALGGQYNFDLTRDWRATARVDWYWQDESFARIHNTEIDRLKSWSNTNLSFWITNPNTGITVEGYVKNVFDETPITGTFLNSDDTGLTTNVFTLEPRLIGVSVRKEF